MVASTELCLARSPLEGPGRSRLPRLRPHVNRRAQQIIAAHMHSGSLASVPSVSSTATVPVLLQIDSTAPRTARTHDISHLCDGAGCLAPRIPPTLIQEHDHVYEKDFLPRDATSVFNDHDGLWHTKVFPSSAPSSRQDAIMLDAWITRSLERYQESGAAAASEDLAHAVEDLVPVLSVALHELVRQVSHHCTERGTALEKIWKAYVELFDRVLHQMREMLLQQKRRTAEVQDVLATARQDLQALRRSHPEQMHRVIADLEVSFTEHQKECEMQLQECEEENLSLKQALRTHLRELDLWYPSFPSYQDSYIKNHIPQHTGNALKRAMTLRRMGSVVDDGVLAPSGSFTPRATLTPKAEATAEEMPPEVAIAEDFKRLLAALAPEKRKLIGKELATLLEAPAAVPSKASSRRLGQPSKEDAEAVLALQAEIREQEERLQALRDEVAQLERQRADEAPAVQPAGASAVPTLASSDKGGKGSASLTVGGAGGAGGRLRSVGFAPEERDGDGAT